MLIGQSFRAENNPFLPPGSGAEKRLSDVVGRVVLSPNSYLDLIYRFRLDRPTLGQSAARRSAVSAGPQNLRVSANYLLIPPQQQSEVVTNPVTGQNVLYGKREQLTFAVTAKLTRYWSLHGSETLNLTNSTNLVNGVATPQSNSTSLYATLSAIYQDECMAFVGSMTQSGISQRRCDAGRVGAVQRRLQESRRNRRHGRLDRRQRRPLTPDRHRDCGRRSRDIAAAEV